MLDTNVWWDLLAKKVAYFPLTFSHSGLKSKIKALHHFGSIHLAKARKVYSIRFYASMAAPRSVPSTTDHPFTRLHGSNDLRELCAGDLARPGWSMRAQRWTCQCLWRGDLVGSLVGRADKGGCHGYRLCGRCSYRKQRGLTMLGRCWKGTMEEGVIRRKGKRTT
jgi:hypothetical protein